MIRYTGFCPICESRTIFQADDDWFRDSLSCQTCRNGSVPRERALALILEETVPNWKNLSIHESSPTERGVSLKLREFGKNYTASHYFPGEKLGAILGIFRNEDLQKLTFNDETHDVFISLDVFEHVPYPDRALREIYRTLKFGGVMLSTFPVRNYQVEPLRRRVDYSPDGSEIHLVEPEIHGNGISGEGSIVTVDYGYDLHKLFSSWAPFDVRVYRFADTLHGILGDYTEVVVCRKEILEEDDPRLSKMI